MSKGFKAWAILIGVFVLLGVFAAVTFEPPDSSGQQRPGPARADQQPIAHPPAATPNSGEASAAVAVIANVEYVDCQTQDAPAWCAEISYATDSERTGTLAMVIRSDAPGEVHWCSRIYDTYKYIGPVTGPDALRAAWGVSTETLAAIGARAISLGPRKGTGSRFIVLPPGMPAPKHLSRCPT